jgi:hypothetical protein
MKTWNNAVIEEVSFVNTQNGDTKDQPFDKTWVDNGITHVLGATANS